VCQSDDACEQVERGRTHDVWKQTKSTRCADRLLSRLGLLLAMHVRNERDMDLGKVVMAHAKLELTHSLDERRAFDIANSPAELGSSRSVN